MSEASDITKKAKSNLAFALLSLPKENRDDVTVFYAFCRKIDDLADEPDLPINERIAGLDRWQHLFENQVSKPEPLELAILKLRDKHQVPNKHFLDLIEGCRMDLHAQRFGTWDELKNYTHRVASTVGLVCLPLFGAKNPDSEDYAETLGHALQLTNIIRDVGEDLDNGSRIYLPLADLNRFQYTERDLIGRVHDQRFIALMNFQADRAEELFAKAQSLLPSNDRRALVAAEVMRSLYHRLLRKMRADNFQVFHQRYRLTKPRKVAALLFHTLKARF